MARSTNTAPRRTRSRLHPVPSIATLAGWRWRQHWFLLLVTTLGMVAAVMLVCAVPLFSEVMQTAGLRSVLTATPNSSELALRATVAGLSTQGVQDVYKSVSPPLQGHLAAYLNGSPQLVVQTSAFSGILSPKPPNDGDTMELYGTSMREAASHVTFIQGRLPRIMSTTIEIAITPAMAQVMHVGVGSIITLDLSTYTGPAAVSVSHSQQPIPQQFKLQIVGLINVKSDDPFWHGQDFLPFQCDTCSNTQYTVLASDQAFLAALDSIATKERVSQVFFSQPSYLYWYYHLAPEHISINQLDDLISQLAATQAYIVDNFSDNANVINPPHIATVDLSSPTLSTPGTPSSLERFRSRLAVARLPAAILALQIIGLLLFFLSFMANLLVDRQGEAIAMLRSRGASGRQVFGSLTTQSLGTGLIALAIGPPLALVAVSFIAQRLLAPADQSALNVLSNAPVQALLDVRWYAVGMVGVAIVAMLFSLYRASRRHLVQQATGASGRPLWQRFNLDVLAAIIALTGYGVSLYLSSIQQLLDAQTQALVASPLALLAPIFLLLAAVLLFLRFFPLLLSLGSGLAGRGRGAAPLLALAQMARAPRQSVRMTLLLALATAFALFTLILSASQTQRAQDIAAYEAGADFSGTIPIVRASTFSLQNETARYQHIYGVISASVGHVGEGTAMEGTLATSASILIQIRAVDSDTFAQATIWSPQDSSQPLPTLLTQLASQRQTALRTGLVPAIVDTSVWNSLALHVGATFSVQQLQGSIQYVVIAEVQHIPTITTSSAGGVLVDYQSFAALQKKTNDINTPVNHAWLRTSDDAAALASVRAALKTPDLRLDDLSDRRLLSETLGADPLSLNLIGILSLGATSALLLAVVANLLASWLSVPTRLTNFVVLRALGAAPNEIARVLLWEQGIVYATAFVLGLVFGALLAVTVVPALVLSSVPASSTLGEISNSEFYALQHALPVQIVIPLSLLLALMVLVSICVLALGLMVRVVLRPALGRTLRIYEDARLDFVTREDVVLAHKNSSAATRRRRRALLPSVVTLGLGRVRQAWFLLLMTGVGIITAVLLVCAVPLFSEVTTTAGLRDLMRVSPASSELTLDTQTQGLSTPVVHSLQHQFDPLVQHHLGSYLGGPPSFSIQATGLEILSPKPKSTYELRLVGTSIDQAAPHLTLVQGRLPQTTGGELETVLTPTTAQSLHMKVGSVLMLHLDTFSQTQSTRHGPPPGTLKVQVVGLFTPTQANDPFWHGENLELVQGNALLSYSLLVPNEAFLAALDQMATQSHANAVFSHQGYDLHWSYGLDSSRLAISQLDDLIDRLNRLQADIASTSGSTQNAVQTNGLPSYPYLLQVSLFNPVVGSYELPKRLDQYRTRIAVVNIPMAILTLEIIGLILFFVSLMATLLVDRQAEAIAILRSRGATSRQIFGSLLTQGVGLGVIALLLGPLLALVAVFFIAQRILAPTEQDTLHLITSQPVQAILTVGGYAVATVLVAVVAMSLVLRGATRMDVLSMRREAARTTHQPLWQRLRLDMVAAIIALVGYGISLYLSSIGKLLDTSTTVLVSAPLALVAPIFLLIGSTLLFLRFFPVLLRFGAWLAGRNRGAGSMLALAQMARAPRQTLRMTLLLALSTAFAIFTLVFSASQTQRAVDIAAYESGADFSGDLVITTKHVPVEQETARYLAISGVSSASVGFTGVGMSSGTSTNLPMQIRAVDSDTFARTAIWTTQDSSQPLPALMAQLSAQRNTTSFTSDVVPAIVDAATMNKLNLQIGSTFTVNVNNLPNHILNCQVIAQVEHIPTVNDSTDPGTVSDYTPPGGVLLDYATYAAVYKRDMIISGTTADPILPLNHVWLRTADDAAALAHVRAALGTPGLRLENLYDRRALIAALDADPLYVDLITIVTLGAATALLLAVVGDLLASWLNVRTRLTNFAVLRALGAAPRQVASVLTWEQGIVYATALVIGVLFGALLAVTVVPTLVFAGVPSSGTMSEVSNGEFYVIQHLIPAQIVVPPTLELVFVALVGICIVALVMMARVVLQPSLSQTLRLNED